MRLIDADAAIKGARENYGGVHDAVLMWLEIAGGVWGLVDIDDNVVWLNRGGSLCLVDIVGLAYRRKPEKGEEHGSVQV